MDDLKLNKVISEEDFEEAVTQSLASQAYGIRANIKNNEFYSSLNPQLKNQLLD